MKSAFPLYIASEGTYADFLTKTAPMLEALATSEKQCASCEEWYPVAEFKGSPYYCPHSQGMETEEDSEVCRECQRDLNEEERYAETGFSQRAWEDHLQDMADDAADGDDY